MRYYRFFLSSPSFLVGALSSFLDERGLYNSATPVRARACYLLLRFVKQTLKSATAGTAVGAGYFEVVAPLLTLLQHQCPDAHYAQLLAQVSAAGFDRSSALASPRGSEPLHTHCSRRTASRSSHRSTPQRASPRRPRPPPPSPPPPRTPTAPPMAVALRHGRRRPSRTRST